MIMSASLHRSARDRAWEISKAINAAYENDESIHIGSELTKTDKAVETVHVSLATMILVNRVFNKMLSRIDREALPSNFRSTSVICSGVDPLETHYAFGVDSEPSELRVREADKLLAWAEEQHVTLNRDAVLFDMECTPQTWVVPWPSNPYRSPRFQVRATMRDILSWRWRRSELPFVDQCNAYAEWLIKDIRNEVQNDIDKEMEKYAQ